MTNNEIWAIFYASVVSMERHPGKTKEGAVPLTLGACASLADAMMFHYNRRFLCPGLDPQSQQQQASAET